MISLQWEKLDQTSAAGTLPSCEATGTPVEPEKSIGPTNVIDFLGIELDTEVMEIRLLADKLARLVQSHKEWRGKKVCRKENYCPS